MKTSDQKRPATVRGVLAALAIATLATPGVAQPAPGSGGSPAAASAEAINDAGVEAGAAALPVAARPGDDAGDVTVSPSTSPLVLPATTAAASPLADKARDASGAIVVPMSSRAGIPFLPGATLAMGADVAEARQPVDDSSVIQGETLLRAGDRRFSITTLRSPERDRAFREHQSPYWAPARPAAPASARAPAIGEPGFDPFNTVHGTAQRQFARAAAAGSTAAADRAFHTAQLRFNRAATAGSTAAADKAHRAAQLNVSRAAASGSTRRADDAFSRAQLRFHRAATTPSVNPDVRRQR